MKNKLFYVIALVLLVQIANAQTFGIKGGLNIANVSEIEDGVTYSPKAIAGIHVGPVLDIPLQGSLNFNTGLLFSVIGYKNTSSNNYQGTSYTTTTTFNDLEIPLNLAYKFPINDKSKFFIQAGPFLGYALSGKVKDSEGSVSIDFEAESIKRFNYGLGIGAGIELGSIVASANYQIGLANMYDDSNDNSNGNYKVKSKVFQISLAYMFVKNAKK